VTRLRLPDPVGRSALGAATLLWVGVSLGRGPTWQAAAAAVISVVAVIVRSRRVPAAICLLVIGVVAGTVSIDRSAASADAVLPVGPVALTARVVVDEQATSSGTWMLVDPVAVDVGHGTVVWHGPTLLVSRPGFGDAPHVVGETIEIQGRIAGASGRAGGRTYRGTVRARRIDRLGGPDDALLAAANAVRRRVADQLAGPADDAAAGLVAGFLIGDTRRLPAVDRAALTEAGLSHFVAVSGSNVALFLVLWWVVVGPLAFGPRRRAGAGTIGLALFAVITRWEPSVLRASVMAGVMLAARAAGLPLTGWTALGTAVGGLVLVSPELIESVGFQLSIAATIGVMGGVRLVATPRWPPLGATWSATVGAQVAVAPLLLWHFGSIPIVSPVANLMAVPAVTISTMAGALGVGLGVSPLVSVAVGAARLVLQVAHVAAGWPSVGVVGLAVALLIGAAALHPVLRPGALATALVGLVVLSGVMRAPVELPAVIFLDVGQGDAALVLGDHGEVVLIDGGPDPVLLMASLRRYRIDRIDLLIVSHAHEDHVGGLPPVVERMTIGAIWHPGHPDPNATFEAMMVVAAQRNIPVGVPDAGVRATVGSIGLAIHGPERRYVGLNDQSVVAEASVGGVSILFPGDVEEIAQADLGPLPADILKVPHHGSATSDLAWLAGNGAAIAIVSVGENSFGHPSEAVIVALLESGATTLRTDLEGDIVIPLGGPLGVGG